MSGVIHLLQDLKCTNDSQSGDIDTLHMAAEEGNDKAIKELISSGMDVDSRYNTSDVTPLYLAAANSHNSTLILLLDQGANIETKVETEVGTLDLLSYAVYKNNTIAVTNLLDNGAEVNRISRRVNMNWYDSINIRTHVNLGRLHFSLQEYAFLNNTFFKYLALKPLGIAAYYCWEDMVELLVNHGSSIDGAKGEISPLAIAIVKGCQNVALKLLKLVASTNRTTAVGWHPLHFVVSLKMKEVIKYLSKTDLLNDRDELGRTPLNLAVSEYRVYSETLMSYGTIPDGDNISKILLDHGADVITVDDEGFTPLHQVISPEIAKVLLERGADVNAQDKYGKTPLHLAVMPMYIFNMGRWLNHRAVLDSANISKILLDHGADVNAKDNLGLTPLYEVSSPETAKVLLQRGADVNTQDQFGNTPLHIHITNRKVNIVKLLLMYNASMDIIRNDVITYSKKFKIYQKFLKIVLPIQTRNNSTPISGFTPMAWAAGYGDREILSLLIERNKSMLNPENYEWPPLHFLVFVKKYSWGVDESAKLKFLIDSGADVNIKDAYSFTPLHKAIMNGNINAVSALLDLNADVNATDINGWTPFLAAVYNQDINIAQMLMKAGCDVNIADVSGFTSLMWSIMGYRHYFFKLMVEKTLDLTSRNRYHYFSKMNGLQEHEIDYMLTQINKTGQPESILDIYHVPIHIYFLFYFYGDVHEKFVDNTNKHINMVKWISEKTADLDMQDKIMGWTALHWASASGDFDVVKLLVERGAYLNLKSYLGHTPMFLARYWGQKDIYEYLKQHGAVW